MVCLLNILSETRWPKEIWKWAPTTRRKRGRPKLSQTRGIKTATNSKACKSQIVMTEDKGCWEAVVDIFRFKTGCIKEV